MSEFKHGMGNGNHLTWQDYLANHDPETSSGTLTLPSGTTGGDVSVNLGEYHSIFPHNVNIINTPNFVQQEKVDHPDHYNTGKLEVIDILKDKLTKEQYKGFLIGNIQKYLFRFEHKNGVEDLKKAAKYLEWLIELEKEI